LRRATWLAVLFAALGTSSGCSPAIWNAYAYNEAQVEAQRGEKPTFIYFRHWADPRCTRFEQDVLDQADVRAALTDFYRVVLQYTSDEELARQCGVTDIPGVAILGPRGRVLATSSGPMKKEALLEFVQRGKQEYAGLKTSGTRAAGSP
jgi:hypothetical protein